MLFINLTVFLVKKTLRRGNRPLLQSVSWAAEDLRMLPKLFFFLNPLSIKNVKESTVNGSNEFDQV